MSRYVLTFNKKGNMRFISHLDLQRLFRRVLYRAEIPVSFSQGFNPHMITNIAAPLSLGFEAERDYFEFESKTELDQSTLTEKLNKGLPKGIAFLECKELPHEKKNLSSVCEYSDYKIFIPTENITEDKINSFLGQENIFILKKDKKTKEMVQKDIKSWIYSMSVPTPIPGGIVMDMVLRTAPNETLNPLSLCQSMLNYFGIELAPEEIRITRMDLFYIKDGQLKSLFEKS